ncbi:MAG: cobalamin-dependent protein [Planctomycetota bacterium]|nr:cobalamin-dependent protein [Planctomycetota bacterium]
MSRDLLQARFLEALVGGDRPAARDVVAELAARGANASQVISELFWPAHETIEKLYKGDQMTSLAYHLSTRLLRMLVDQTGAALNRASPRGETIFCACGPSQGEELAAQMACDLLEADGFDVTFAGGGVPGDEILCRVQETQPNYLVMFASAASDLPEIRRIIDTLREIGACRKTKMVVGGGVFNRADGLAEEIGIDLWCYSPADLVDLLTLPPEPAHVPTPIPVPAAARAASKVTPRKTRAAA